MPLRWCRPAAPRTRVRFAATRPCACRGRVGSPSPAGGVSHPFRVGLFPGGVPWLLSRCSPLLRPWFVPPARLSRPGPVARLACRSARRPALCRVSWRWRGFLPPPLLAASRVPGVAACRRPVSGAWCGRCRVALPFRCRSRRRRFRLAAAGLLVGWLPCSRLVAGWRRSVALACVRRRASARLRGLVALAALFRRGRSGVLLALRGPCRLSPRWLVRLGRCWPGGSVAPPLAGRRALGCPPALGAFRASWRRSGRARRAVLAAGRSASGPAARWFFSLSFSFRFRCFFPPGPAFLAALAGIKNPEFL